MSSAGIELPRMRNRGPFVRVLSSAAFISAALALFLAVGWIFVAQVHAQVPMQVEGQLFNGTQDVPACEQLG